MNELNLIEVFRVNWGRSVRLHARTRTCIRKDNDAVYYLMAWDFSHFALYKIWFVMCQYLYHTGRQTDRQLASQPAKEIDNSSNPCTFNLMNEYAKHDAWTNSSCFIPSKSGLLLDSKQTYIIDVWMCVACTRNEFSDSFQQAHQQTVQLNNFDYLTFFRAVALRLIFKKRRNVLHSNVYVCLIKLNDNSEMEYVQHSVSIVFSFMVYILYKSMANENF